MRAGAAAAAHNLAIDRLEAARTTLRLTRGELRTARRDLATSRRVLAERLVDLYVAGRPTFMEVLLTSGSIGEAYEAGDVLDQAARGDARVLEAVRARGRRLTILEARQAAAEAAREREEASAQERKDELAALAAERQRLLADAKADLRRLVKEERERRARLAALGGGPAGVAELPPLRELGRGRRRAAAGRLPVPGRRAGALQRRLARPALRRPRPRGHRHLRGRGDAHRRRRRRLALQRRLQRPRRLAPVVA